MTNSDIATTHHLLLEAARMLAASRDLPATLEQVTDFLVPQLADWCQVYLAADGEDGGYLRVAAKHVHPGIAVHVERLADLPGQPPARITELVDTVARTGRPVLVADAGGAGAETDEGGAEFVPRSYAVLPLVVRGAPLGALGLVSAASARRYDPADETLAELLEMFAARVALALDAARLYDEVRRAHERELRTARLEAQLVQARLETLRAQLRPHFLFNALNTIAMLVRRGANAEALRGIVGLSQLLREILARRDAPEVSLGEELALLDHYLAIERLRYPDRLAVRVAVPQDLLEARVPNLLLQPLVENAVRHGIGNRRDRGSVRIEARRSGEWLVLEVRDDGPGFAGDWSIETSPGIGLANTRERLHRLYGARQRFEARNAAGGGALVAVALPYHTAAED